MKRGRELKGDIKKVTALLSHVRPDPKWSKPMNRPFIKTGCIGVLVILMSIVLMRVFPKKAPVMPEGFFTPIIAFEFIQSRAEVVRMFGGSDIETRLEMVKAMDLGNRLDYIYMCLYSMFLLMFSAGCAKASAKKYYYTGVLIAVMVLLADALENVQLLSITSKIANGDFDAELVRLHMFTWIKWGGIATVFLMLSPWFMKGKFFSKIIGATGLASFILGAVSYLHRSVVNEIFCLTVGVMFLLMIIYCFTYKTAPLSNVKT